MKKTLKIIGIILLIIAILLAALVIWQRENIIAVYTAMTKNSEEISKEIEKSQKNQYERMQEEYKIDVKPIDAAQTQDLLNGKADPEKLKEEMGITVQLKNEGTSPPSSQANKKEQINNLLNKCSAEMYACEIDLMTKLGGMKQAALDKWFAIPKEERKKNKLIQIGLSGLEECYELELSADRKIKEIMAKYKPQLKELGADTKVIDDMWKLYCDKKAGQKAYYLNKYIK